MINNFPPGHYPELDDAAYHAAPGVSKSHLDTIAEGSPAHYYAKHLDPNREPGERTPALVLGDAIHKAVLEPDLFTSRFAAWRGGPRNTKEGKPEWAEFSAANLGKTVLTADQYDTAVAIRDVANKHPIARGLLCHGEPEQSYFAIDELTGELIKCRPDYDRLAYDGMMVDIKSTETAGPDAFGKDAHRYRYHVQGAWYPFVVERLQIPVQNFVFLAIEKSPPYAIASYVLEAADARIGMMEARRDLMRIAECRAAGKWPDYAAEFGVQSLILPPWARRQQEAAE